MRPEEAGRGPRWLGEAAIHGALIGVVLGIVESAAIAGAYWFDFPGGWEMRAFALVAIGLDALQGVLLATMASLLAGPRRGLPAAAFVLFLVAGVAHATTNFGGSFEGLGGTAAGVALALALAAAVAAVVRRLPSGMPRGFHARPRYLLLLVLAVAVVLFPERPPRPTGRGPNVLVVVADTLRQDVLGHTGSPRARTPHLDRLARTGAILEEPLTASNSTPSSLASILTGLEVRRHGLRGFHQLLEQRFLTLGEAFQQRGYRTFGLSSSFPGHLAYHQFDQGLDVRDDTSIPRSAWTPPWEALERLALLRLAASCGVPVPKNKVPSTREADLTLARLAALWRRSTAEPFFGFVHFFDPHAPYSPPAEFSDYGDLGRVSRGDLDARLAAAGMEKPGWLARPIDVGDAAFPVAAYFGEAAFLDAEMGRLLASIRRSGAADRTVVAFVADHGESLLEPRNGMLFNHDGLYDNVMRVPLVVAGPGVPAGVVVPGIVRTVDLMPTLLALAGGEAAGGIDGVSLVPRLTGAASPPPSVAFIEAPHGRLWALRQGSMKLVRTHGDRPPALYDLALDPGESHDLCAERPEVAAAMRAEAERRLEGSGSSEGRTLDQEQIESLRGLGYLGPASTSQELPPGCGEAVSGKPLP